MGLNVLIALPVDLHIIITFQNVSYLYVYCNVSKKKGVGGGGGP